MQPGRLCVALAAATSAMVASPRWTSAQVVNATRLAILQAEDRRAPTATDLATIRAGTRSGDPLTAVTAVRALGRLERPALATDIQPLLDSPYPSVRVEAANALAQAVSSIRRGASGGPSTTSLVQVLAAHLDDEEEPDVRAALAESIGRLPYADADGVARAQAVLVELAAKHGTVADRLGVSKAFEALARAVKGVALTEPAVDVLRGLVGVMPAPRAESPEGPVAARPTAGTVDPSRDARVRRLAMEALVTSGLDDEATITRAVSDTDQQVRRLGIRAAARGSRTAIVTRGLEDPAGLVRFEAVRSLADVAGRDACAWTLAATADADPHVVLLAIDRLGACAGWDQAVTRLADLAADHAALATPRSWHRAAHAIVALASAAPERAKPLLQAFGAAANPFVRAYAARTAVTLGDRAILERLAGDADDNVAEVAVDGLVKVAGTDATPKYLAALTRRGYQVVRAAARALESSPADADTRAALERTLEWLTSEAHDNSLAARRAVVAALEKQGAQVPDKSVVAAAPRSTLELAELKRVAAPRARITIRGVGSIDLALFTAEAPATVVQFARLAESGYYNGLTIHRVVPTFVFQGGSPGANEYIGHPNYMRDELGTWPHVRGAVGISTRGRDTGDAQFFLNLVDNPRLDHDYTVFGQVLAGLETADKILEGDVIESVQILDAQ
jgi:cyclophilin family peptidyl-prolyl cis-trans isomerase